VEYLTIAADLYNFLRFLRESFSATAKIIIRTANEREREWQISIKLRPRMVSGSHHPPSAANLQANEYFSKARQPLCVGSQQANT
jgi:hypothetical protein